MNLDQIKTNGNGKVHGLVKRIMNGSEILPAECIVENAIENALLLAQYGDSVKEALYQIAVQEQKKVLDARTRTFENLYRNAVRKRKDLDQYNDALNMLLELGRSVQYTAARMRRLENLRGMLTNGNGKH
jgi:hypothetical protein